MHDCLHTLQLRVDKGTCSTRLRPLLPSTPVDMGRVCLQGGLPVCSAPNALTIQSHHRTPGLLMAGLAVSTGTLVAAHAEPDACTVSHAHGGGLLLLLLLEVNTPCTLRGCPSGQSQIRHESQGISARLSAGMRHRQHTCEARAWAAGGGRQDMEDSQACLLAQDRRPRATHVRLEPVQLEGGTWAQPVRHSRPQLGPAGRRALQDEALRWPTPRLSPQAGSTAATPAPLRPTS